MFPPMDKKSKGYITLPREITEHSTYAAEPFCKLAAWIDLILLANYKESKYFCNGKPIKIMPGQLAISQETLAGKWRWSRGRVIRFLNGLETVQEIVQTKTHATNLITILKYRSYCRAGTTVGTGVGTMNGTTVGTHPNKSKIKKESDAPIPSSHGFAPIKKIAP